MSEARHHDYIDNTEQLNTLCQALQTRDHISIDTEFIRESTYRPQLCLIQLKSADVLAIIDTIAVKDLSPLTALLDDRSITKVFHAAAQDLEIFYILNGTVPKQLFDTQIAAPLLGYNEQIGYGNLVKELLKVNLPKAHTRADWSHRPLTPQQIQYALDDVIYLEDVYLQMRAELSRLNRLDWLQADFIAMEDVTKYDKPAQHAWRKMRGAQKLKNQALSIFQALAEWRELQAQKSNLPRSWLIKDDVLIDISRQMPTSIHEVQQIRGLSNRVKKQHAERVAEIVRQSREREPEPIPGYSRKPKLTSQQQVAIDALTAFVSLRASELNINPSLLANRKLLEDCARTGDSSAIQGWRRPLLCTELDNLMQGRTKLSFKNGQVVCE